MDIVVDSSMKAPPNYNPHVVLTGVSYRTLDVAGREKLVRETASPELLAKKIVAGGFASEAAVISTCNRFEVVTVNEQGPEGGEPGGGIRSFFTSLLDVSSRSSLYQFVDSSAVRHLYRVSSSLDSMVLGEAQILGQVKEAYNKAVREGVVGTHLHHLFQSAFHVAKKVRAQTEVSQHGVSVSYVGVRLAQQIFADLSDTSVLIIGSGEMAELAALHLCSHGCKRIIVANRTVERAAELAERFGGSAIALSDVDSVLNQIDIAIGSIRIDHAILTKSSLKGRRDDKPLFLIDLGLPRNFAPDLGDVDSVYLYNLDDLIGIADQNKALREAAAREAEIVIDYGLLQFERWRVKIGAQPELVNLRDRVHSVCDEEVAKALAALPPEDRTAIAAQLARGIAQKLAHNLSDLVSPLPRAGVDSADRIPFLIVPHTGIATRKDDEES